MNRVLLAVSSGAQDYYWLPHQCLPLAYIDEFDRELLLPAVGTGMQDKCWTFTNTRAIDLFNVPLQLPLAVRSLHGFCTPREASCLSRFPCPPLSACQQRV